jgi:hypothetical protein
MILELLRQGKTIVEIQREWNPENGPLGEAVAAAHEQLKKEQLMEQSAARATLVVRAERAWEIARESQDVIKMCRAIELLAKLHRIDLDETANDQVVTVVFK